MPTLKSILSLCITLGLCILATLANPNGMQHHNLPIPDADQPFHAAVHPGMVLTGFSSVDVATARLAYPGPYRCRHDQ